MFILVGTDGTDLTYVRDEARAANERYRVHNNTPWFNARGGDPAHPGASDTTRATFRGHGSTARFGGYTPQQFVTMLAARKTAGDFPDTITTIDLIGCDIGLRKGDNPSWVEQVGALLRADARFNHITNINAVTHHDQHNAYGTLISYAGKKAVLMTADQWNRYDTATREKEARTARIGTLNHEITVKRQQLAANDDYQTLLGARQDVATEQATVNRLTQRQTQINGLVQDLTNLLNGYNARGANLDTKNRILGNIAGNNFTTPAQIERGSIYSRGVRVPKQLKDARALLARIRALDPAGTAQDLRIANLALEHANGLVNHFGPRFAADEQYIATRRGQIATLNNEIDARNTTIQEVLNAATNVGNSQATPRAFVETLPGLQRGADGGDFGVNARAAAAAVAVDVDLTTAESAEPTPVARRISVPSEPESRHNTHSGYSNYHSIGNTTRWQPPQCPQTTARTGGQHPETASAHTTTPAQPSAKTSTHTSQAEPDSAADRPATRPH